MSTVNSAPIDILGGKPVQDLVIVGGGAAGCMAAAAAWEQNPNLKLKLLEKNSRLGQKVLISGGGRCNVTTGIWDKRVVADRYPRGWKFLQSAFYAFPPEAVIAWFEAQGVPLKTEDDGRVFPVSNQGAHIVEVFEREFEKHPHSLLFRAEVQQIKKLTEPAPAADSNAEESLFEIQLKSGEIILTRKVILACGGQAYRQTGSTGDAYSWVEALGHTVTTLAPSLNAFLLKEKWDLAGVALKKVTLKTPRNKSWSFTGPVLFTHKGLTGPAVFAFSALTAFEVYDAQNPMELRLDFLPDWPQELFRTTLEKELSENPKKWFRNALSQWIPKSLAATLCEQLEIPEDRLNHEISKKNMGRMIETLKNASLHVVGRAAGEEFVTAGGVSTDEVDPKTCESKLCKGLYFAGELLNIDGFTGGYNLQCAWATGYKAGTSAGL